MDNNEKKQIKSNIKRKTIVLLDKEGKVVEDYENAESFIEVHFDENNNKIFEMFGKVRKPKTNNETDNNAKKL